MRAIAAAMILLFQVQTTPPRASIEGVVTRATDGEPVAGALVAAYPSGTVSQGVDAGTEMPPIRTDAEGRFTVGNLSAGAYRLTVSANGYVRQEYGQRAPTLPGIPIVLSGGQTVKNIAAALTPAGNVSGHVRSATGRPIPGVYVRLLRRSYDAQGNLALSQAGDAQTNDLGEYRIYWVAPGQYYARVGSFGIPTDYGQLPYLPAGYNMARNDSGLFYPGVTELEKATRIAVQPGDEAGPIDFTLTRREVGNVSSASLRRIRVQLIDETTGAASTRATAVVEEQNSKGGYNEGGAYQSSNGQIQTRILAPGTYRITATAPEGAGNPGSRGSTIVTLGDSDVDVVLTLASLPKIDGRLQAEGVLSASNMRNLRIALSPAPPDQSSIRQPFAEGGSLKADGTFTLSGATAGVYRVKISGLPAGFFVKHARFDGADVLNSAVSFSRSGQLDILISEKSGRLDGVALNNQGQPFERAAVVLVPDAARNRPELFRSAVTDAAGRFTISGVVPGRYKVSALEAMEPNAYFDPDFIAQFDLVGRPVEIAESARESVELMVIPWGNAP